MVSHQGKLVLVPQEETVGRSWNLQQQHPGWGLLVLTTMNRISVQVFPRRSLNRVTLKNTALRECWTKSWMFTPASHPLCNTTEGTSLSVLLLMLWLRRAAGKWRGTCREASWTDPGSSGRRSCWDRWPNRPPSLGISVLACKEPWKSLISFQHWDPQAMHWLYACLFLARKLGRCCLLAITEPSIIHGQVTQTALQFGKIHFCLL